MRSVIRFKMKILYFFFTASMYIYATRVKKIKTKNKKIYFYNK